MLRAQSYNIVPQSHDQFTHKLESKKIGALDVSLPPFLTQLQGNRKAKVEDFQNNQIA